MREKKLLAAACAVGILGWGGCFLPPPRQPHPPPPPLAASLGGIHRMCVKVTSQSETHHADPDAVGRGIIEALHDHKDANPPAAYFAGEARPGDALLQVSIVNEAASAEPVTPEQSSSRWNFQLTIDASLINPNGVVLWQELNRVYRFDGRVLADNSAAAWESKGFADWIRYSVCARLVSRILYGFQ